MLATRAGTGEIVFSRMHKGSAGRVQSWCGPFVDELAVRLRFGERLLVHCAAGIGRAGTTAVCVLIRLGMPMTDALATVRASRPMAGPEAGPQLDLVRAVAAAS